MKKVMAIAALIVSVFSSSLYAQGGVHVAAGDITGVTPSESMTINFTKIEARNTVKLPDGKGTITFFANGDKFSDVVFTDAAGKANRLAPMPRPTAGAPNQPCKYPIPDACFGTANKNVLMCMCRPTDISAAGSGDPTAILIGLLLPAVQKVREAARN